MWLSWDTKNESFLLSAPGREALVQRPSSFWWPLILAMKKKAIPLAALEVGCEAVHSAFPGSGLPVEGGMALLCI